MDADDEAWSTRLDECQPQQHPPPSLSSFHTMELHPQVLHALQSLGFEQPTSVQHKAIPLLLQRSDVIAQAPSGSGKTIAFAAPIVTLCLTSQSNQDPASDEHQHHPVLRPGGGSIAEDKPPRNVTSPRALIVVPTSSLAEQVHRVFGTLCQASSIRPALVTGGKRFITGFGPTPDILIATPLKLLDMLGMCSSERTTAIVSLNQVEVFVCDEVDELMEKVSFQEQMAGIIRQLPSTACMGFFSATMTPFTRDFLFEQHLVKPDAVEIKANDGVKPQIQHFHVFVPPCNEEQVWEEKAQIIDDLLAEFQGGGVIVFVKGRGVRDFLLEGFKDSPRVTDDLTLFQSRRNGVLIAMDGMSRGIDIHHVAVVINFDLPRSASVYTQRVGRAGRCGKAGTAISLVTTEDRFDMLQNQLGMSIPPLRSLASLPGYGQNSVIDSAAADSSSILPPQPKLQAPIPQRAQCNSVASPARTIAVSTDGDHVVDPVSNHASLRDDNESIQLLTSKMEGVYDLLESQKETIERLQHQLHQQDQVIQSMSELVQRQPEQHRQSAQDLSDTLSLILETKWEELSQRSISPCSSCTAASAISRMLTPPESLQSAETVSSSRSSLREDLTGSSRPEPPSGIMFVEGVEAQQAGTWARVVKGQREQEYPGTVLDLTEEAPDSKNDVDDSWQTVRVKKSHKSKKGVAKGPLPASTVRVGQIYRGEVKKILSQGSFVTLFDDNQGGQPFDKDAMLRTRVAADLYRLAPGAMVSVRVEQVIQTSSSVKIEVSQNLN